MKTRILLKHWLGAWTLCALFIGAICITPNGRVKEPVSKKPSPPVKLEDAKKSGTELTPDPVLTLLVLATLDGTLTAVDRVSGELRWVSKDEPMIKVPAGPASAKAPYFLPDPKTGSLYVMGRKNSLRKLPFTIPQLVAMAPCRNSEGLMYTGRKLDYWLNLNPTTGEKSQLPSFGDSTCPAKSSEDDISPSCTAHDNGLPGILRKPLLIGKTEYVLSMVDGPRKWNVTYHHYSSVDMTAQSAQDYDLVHFTSPSTGSVLTYDRESGQLLWQRELASPVIAVYNVDCVSSNLISVPFNPIAPETLLRLKSVASQNNKPLSHTTYIGESNYGLYAVPALVDEMVLLMASEGTTQFPPLIEGPSIDSNDTPLNSDNKNNDLNHHHGTGTPNNPNNSFESQSNSAETDFLLLGYYDIPEPTGKSPPVMQIGSSSTIDSSQNSLPAGQFNDSESEIAFIPPENNSKDKLELMDPVPLTQPASANNKVQFPPFPMPIKPLITPIDPQKIQERVKPFKIVFTTAAISVVATIIVIIVGMMTYRKFYAHKVQKQRRSDSNKKEKASDTEEDVPSVKKSKKSADGSSVSVGKICFYPTSVLGKGCEGTFVYKGKFEDRDVAVKRILPECFAFADREVDLLKESDQHPNVIRYFCTEADDQFRYIALELCEATLSDWIEGKFISEFMDPIQILREATDGLAHLHSLQIVHRDIKPANVLLSVQPNGKQVKTMISDFGLCKKIANGRMSFSRRSGGIPGTEGWIAPEVIKNMDKEPQMRMSYSVDIFSLGCVYYFVMTNGDHPFGEPFRRQSNIVNDDCNLGKVFQNPQGVFDLISLMISADANVRPPLEDVLCHPMFWSKEKMLAFFLDVSDRIEKEDESKCPLLRRLESDGTRIVRNDWRDHICPEVAMDLRRYRTYKGHSVRDLLRALRNKKNHYRELTPEAQASLGHIPEQFVYYWLSRFPDLLPYTWLIFESVRYESIFAKYYPKTYSFNAHINGQHPDPNFGLDYDNDDIDEGKLNVHDKSSSSPEKSPKIDKNFWRSKSQFKYNKWRRQQQNTNIRENPHNFVSYGTTRYPPQQTTETLMMRSPDTDNSWRNPVPKDK